MTRLVVIAVLVLAAVAAADSLRPRAGQRAVAGSARAPGGPIVHATTSSGFSPAGGTMRNRVLLNGRDFLSSDEIARAFPTQLHGALFDIAHLAAGEDGTLVVAIYAFPHGGQPADGIEIWRRGRLESSFLVPVGTFGGGIGFADHGRLIAALSGDGLAVNLFSRRGRAAGTISPTSW
jgi:hypothetical protein